MGMSYLHFFLLFAALAVTGSRGEIHETRYVNGSCTYTAGRDGTHASPFCYLQSALELLPYNTTVLVFLQGQFVRTPFDPPFAIADNKAAKLILQTDPQQTEPASFSCESLPPSYFNCPTLFSVSGGNTTAGSVILFRDIRFQGYSGGLLEASSLGSSFVEVVLEEVTVEGCGQDSPATGFAVNDGVGSTLRVERSTFRNNSYSALLTASNVIVEDSDFRGNRNSGATIKGEHSVAVRRSSITGGIQTIDAWDGERVEVSRVIFKGTDSTAVNVVMSPSVSPVSFVMEHCLFEDLIAPALSYKRGTGEVVKREFTSPAGTPFASSFPSARRPPQKRQLAHSQMTIVDSTFRRVSMNSPVVEILEFSYLNVTDYYLADLLFDDNNEVLNADTSPAEMNMRIDVGATAYLTTVTMERLQFHQSAVPSIVVPPAEDDRLLYLILRDIIVQDSGQLSFDGVSLQMENVVVERSEGLFLRRLTYDSFIKDSFFLFNGSRNWSEPTLFVDSSSISWNEGGGIVVNGSTVVVSRSNIWGNRMEGGLACSFGASIIAENDNSIYKNNYDRTLQAFSELTCDGSCSIAIPSAEDGCALAAASCPQGFDACSSCQGTNECVDCTGVPFGQNNCSSPLRYRLSADNETTVVLQFNGSQPHATLLPINQTTGEAEEHNYAQWVWQSVWKEEEEVVLEGGDFVRCGPVVSKSKNGKIRSLRMIHSMLLENGASLVVEQYLLGEDTTFWLGGNQSEAPANSLKSSIRIYDWVVETGSSLNLRSKLFFSDPIFALINEADDEDGDTGFSSLTILTDATTTSLSVALWFLAEQQYSNRVEFVKKQEEGTEDEIQLTFQFEGPFSSLEYDPNFSVLLGGGDVDDGSEEDGEENDDTLKIVLPAVLVSVVVVSAIVGVIATRVVMKWRTKRSLKRAPHLKAVNYRP